MLRNHWSGWPNLLKHRLHWACVQPAGQGEHNDLQLRVLGCAWERGPQDNGGSPGQNVNLPVAIIQDGVGSQVWISLTRARGGSVW